MFHKSTTVSPSSITTLLVFEYVDMCGFMCHTTLIVFIYVCVFLGGYVWIFSKAYDASCVFLLMPVRADHGQVWVSPSVSSGLAAWRSAHPSVIHRKSLTPASVSLFVMSKSALCALTEGWKRTQCLLPLWGAMAAQHPYEWGSERGSRSPRTFSNGCQILPPPFGKHVPCTMLICHSKWLTWLVIVWKVDFFSPLSFDCLFFAGFTLHQSCRQRQRVHESHWWPYAGWLQRFTICSQHSWCVGGLE